MRNLWLITKEDFKNLITNPMWVFYATAFPVLLVMIMGFLTRDNYGDGFSSFDFYGITLMIYSAINGGMTASNSFMEERIKKPNMRIVYAPGNVKDIYLSKMIASFVFNAAFHLLDLAFLVLVFHVHLNNVAKLLILFLLLELCANALGIMLCCIFKTEQMTNQLQSIVVNILAIFGGLLFSLDGYGEVVRKISLISPVKWVMDASFQMIYDNNDALFLPCAGILVAVIAGMIAVCRITFRKEDCLC
ncbi:MAG: ABC transporter permease [bacterium]|nr:ABC transporter permease [bacterium]